MNGKTTMLLAAYALFLSLTGDFLWGGYIAYTQGLVSQPSDTLFECLTLSFMLPLALIACSFACARRAAPATGRRNALAIVLPFAAIELGGAALAVESFTGAYSLPLALATATLLSAGCGVSFCTFQRELARLPLRDAGFVVIGAAVVSPLVYFALGALGNGARLIVDFVLIAPLCCALCLVFSRSDPSAGTLQPASERASDRTPAHTSARTTVRAALARFFACRDELAQPLAYIAFSAFVVGLFQAATAGDERLATANAIKMGGLLVSGIVLAVAWWKTADSFEFDLVYKIVFPLVATSYLLLPTLAGDFWYLCVGFSFLVFAIVSALMVITCLTVARNRDLEPVGVYGLFAGIVYLALALGSLLGFAFRGVGFWGPTALTTVALLMVYLLAITRPFGRMGRDGTPAMDAARSDAPTVNASVQTESATGAQAATHASVDETDAGTGLLRTRLKVAYPLSERELDVVCLLACGRDVPAIARRLCLSENTIRTHTKGIYSKLGVHTKQELLDKLEDDEGTGANGINGATGATGRDA